MNGGDIIADVLQRQGVRFLFTLCGGHISPILVGAEVGGGGDTPMSRRVYVGAGADLDAERDVVDIHEQALRPELGLQPVMQPPGRAVVGAAPVTDEDPPAHGTEDRRAAAPTPTP